MIDLQNTYREGVMKLERVEPAIKEASRLLARAREAGCSKRSATAARIAVCIVEAGRPSRPGRSRVAVVVKARESDIHA